MVPETFDNFFLAMAGAGGALIGLLFVAISIDPERTFGPGVDPGRQRVASGAYMALVNGFFISTCALLPHANVGDVALPVGFVGLASTIALGRDLVRHQWRRAPEGLDRWRGVGHALLIVTANLILYGYEVVLAIQLLQHPHNAPTLFTLAGILLGVYAVGLARAWQLLGAPGGILKWLDPLQVLTDTDGPAVPEPAMGRDG
jgi:hypothetical protein